MRWLVLATLHANRPRYTPKTATFRRALSDRESIQIKMGDLAMVSRSARLLVDEGRVDDDQWQFAKKEVSMAKTHWRQPLCTKAARVAIQ